MILERTDAESMRSALSGMCFDVVIDKLAYCSNDIKYAMESIIILKVSEKRMLRRACAKRKGGIPCTETARR